jgi:predicted glycosyltransferase
MKSLEASAQNYERGTERRGDVANRGKRRIALYSHDGMGIGHMRRNLLIAQALIDGPFETVILLIAGARELSTLGLPPEVDCLTLPSLYKEGNGQYQPRRLDISLEELIVLRSRTLTASLAAFRPDVLIVDKVPRGAVNELDGALAMLRAEGRTRCVLGLRDVLDDPDTVRREWSNAANHEAIRAYYDAIWIYGDRTIYDPVREYAFGPALAAKVHFTGYLDQRLRTRFAGIDGGEWLAPLLDSSDRLVLCMLGGGQDGCALAEAFSLVPFEPGVTGVILPGPFMPPDVQQRLTHRASLNAQLRVIKFVTDSDLLLDRANCVVGMGGYNTVCEVLSFEKSALIVPRVHPRTEQLIRAERLRERGLLDVLHPHALSPQALTDWLRGHHEPLARVRERIDLNGQSRIPSLIEELLGSSSGWQRGWHSQWRNYYVPR